MIDPRPFMTVPFLLHGRTMAGADCLGLTELVLASRGIALPDDWHAQARSLWAEESTALRNFAPPGWETLERPAGGWTRPVLFAPADILATGHAGIAQHVAPVVDPHYALHTRAAWTPRLVQHEQIRDHILWVWRHPESLRRFAS